MTRRTDTLIIGGGLTGLVVAHTLRTSCYGHRSILLEKTESTGGVIRSHREEGFIAENGPHGFLDNCPESRRLLEECGLAEECVKAPLINFVRYVLLDGKLKMIPQTPRRILMAPLIPWRAKLRVLAELWQPPLAGEPTVAKWVAHRFGPALLPFADAVFTGTYAGDMNRLSIDSVMPGLRALEKSHGSLLKGLLARAKSKKSGGGKRFTMPAMTSFPEGMERLPAKLAASLTEDEDLFCNCEVQKIHRQDETWHLETSRGAFAATNLVLAVPVNTALKLLAAIDTPPVSSIAEAEIATVVFGFGSGSQLPPGFGYLVPEQERRFSLGTLFSSNMFSGRAPAGHILFETLVGGRRHPERLELSDAEMTRRALEDVREVLPLQGEPVYTRVLRPWGGIPQLESHYPELLAWRDGLMENRRGLHICGFGWQGIGLNDMIKYGMRCAMEIGKAGGGPGKTEIKGVYF